jgi:sulfur carrier protein ThiS
MELFFEKTNSTKTLKLSKPISIQALLAKYSISAEEVIVIKNNEICLEDELISNTDKIKILSVVSGG